MRPVNPFKDLFRIKKMKKNIILNKIKKISFKNNKTILNQNFIFLLLIVLIRINIFQTLIKMIKIIIPLK